MQVYTAKPNSHTIDILAIYFISKKTKYLLVDKGVQQKLTRIAKWIEALKLKIFLDSACAFAKHKEFFNV